MPVKETFKHRRLGEALLFFRNRVRMSQHEVAQAVTARGMKLSPVWYSKLERGELQSKDHDPRLDSSYKGPSVELLQEILNVLGTDFDELDAHLQTSGSVSSGVTAGSVTALLAADADDQTLVPDSPDPSWALEDQPLIGSVTNLADSGVSYQSSAFTGAQNILSQQPAATFRASHRRSASPALPRQRPLKSVASMVARGPDLRASEERRDLIGIYDRLDEERRRRLMAVARSLGNTPTD